MHIYIQSQGQTIKDPNSIFSDLSNTFQAGMAYVILSRITSMKQLYLKDFDDNKIQKKIYCSPVAKKEAQRFRLDFAGCVWHGGDEASKLCQSRDLHITLCDFFYQNRIKGYS